MLITRFGVCPSKINARVIPTMMVLLRRWLTMSDASQPRRQ